MNITQYLFENSAELSKNFILGNKETISYKRLYKQSTQIAGYLFENFGEGNNILLVSSNNSFFVSCYLGIMLSGNVCVPIDPTIEQENLNYIINECNAIAGFVESKLLNKRSFQINKLITDNDYLNLINSQTDFKISDSFDTNRPAQIIFTSGSTSQPKGVVLSHKNIIANTSSIVEYLNLSENDIMEVVLPFYYCYGLSLLHTHLRVGGSVVLNNNFILTGSVLNDLNKYSCTGFAGVPSHFQILLRKTKNFKNLIFPSLRYVTQAGGKLHNSFIEEFNNSFPEIDFFVMYGQTEATARLSYLQPKDLIKKLGSIGNGIPGVELKVVNKNFEKVVPGETGEIIARGENIMLGYYNDAKTTNEVIKNGWLFTGDLGTIDEDGYIYITAREKEIIKVFGNRVSPKEIEEVIVSYPGVVDCTIELVSDEITGEAMKAIVVLNNSENNITSEILKIYCSKKLAKYKIPKIIEFSDNVKVNSVGKKVKISRIV